MVATLTVLEAAELIATSHVDVIDVRDHDEWSAGHLPAARVIPLDVLRADTDRALQGNPAGVLFVCARGVRSLNAAMMAARLGYDRVYSLDGGTSAWAAAGLPLVASAERVAA